eukprot:c19274_g2_i1 orf=143-397(+)
MACTGPEKGAAGELSKRHEMHADRGMQSLLRRVEREDVRCKLETFLQKSNKCKVAEEATHQHGNEMTGNPDRGNLRATQATLQV